MKYIISLILLFTIGIDNETDYEIVKTSISQNAFSPTKFKNGLIFTSKKDNSKFYKLYFSQIIRKQILSKPIEIVSNHNFLHMSNGIYLPSSDEFYFTSNNYPSPKLAIYKCKIQNGILNNPEILKFCTVDKAYGHSTFSKNGLKMIISSGDSKNIDLELYQRKNIYEKWVFKKKLSELNSRNFEVHPSLINDSLIVFSRGKSKGKKLELYFSNLDSIGNWTEPKKFDELNSKYDDLGVIFTDKNSGYFSSNRSGKDEIFFFEKKP